MLTDEDVSSGDRTRIRRRLEREGVDVGALVTDLVSYQAIRTHLTEYRNAEYTGSDEDRLEQDVQSIMQLRSRLEPVAESKLDRLRDAGEISVGEFRMLVDTAIVCEECGTRLSVKDLLDEKQCDCYG